MQIILGIVAALCFGSADFVARFCCRQLGAYRTFFYMQISGAITLTFFLIVTGELWQLLILGQWRAWECAIIAALLNAISTLALYRAIEIGALVVVMPIVSCYAVVTVLLAMLNGEQLKTLQSIGIAAVLVGVRKCVKRRETADRKKGEGKRAKPDESSEEHYAHIL
jgi:uncharacterized membrane protein